MNNKNTPPFYVGQRVVLLIDGDIFGHKKGSQHVIKDIWYGCHSWFVDVGWISPVSTTRYCRICDSKLVITKGDAFYPDPCRFAPILPAYEQVTFEQVTEHNPVSLN
jgi:hypothetical protein